MQIAFYIDEMNLRGVANSTFKYAFYNEKILNNKSIIFYNKKNHRNLREVIIKFKKNFKIFGINNFENIDLYKKKLKIDYIYTQKSGEKDDWVSNNIKTLNEALKMNRKLIEKKILCWTVRSPSEEAKALKLCSNITFEGFFPLKNSYYDYS